MSRAKSIVRLSEMLPDQEGDLFALMTLKEEHTTREGKRYFKVGFRDAGREVVFPVWDNSPFAAACRDQWTPGRFYKLRAVYRQSPYGPQLDLRKVRETCPADAEDGFDPLMCLPRSRFDAAGMYGELRQLVAQRIPPGPLRRLVEELLEADKERLVLHPAGRHHHAFCGGLLEHTLSMARCCAMLADEYAAKYPDLQPPLDKALVVAGAVLHDLGKVEELAWEPADTAWTPAGALLGHVFLGRDKVRQAAGRVGLDDQTLLRLEHVIVAHQFPPEAAPPRPPMTPEALIVQAADYLAVQFDIMVEILRRDPAPGPLTSDKNLLHRRLYRGAAPDERASGRGL